MPTEAALLVAAGAGAYLLLETFGSLAELVEADVGEGDVLLELDDGLGRGEGVAEAPGEAADELVDPGGRVAQAPDQADHGDAGDRGRCGFGGPIDLGMKLRWPTRALPGRGIHG